MGVGIRIPSSPLELKRLDNIACELLGLVFRCDAARARERMCK